MRANDLTFNYIGAITSFIVFQAAIGLVILRKIYKCLAANETSCVHSASSDRAAGYGYSASYFFQAMSVILGGGLVVGTYEELMQGKFACARVRVSDC